MGSRTKLFLSLLLLIGASWADDYRGEVPLKMLDVRSLASRYPASNSEHRTNLENGFVSIRILTNLDECFYVWSWNQDEDIDRTESDELNGFPAKKLTLQPGGCGYYEFEIKPGQVNSFIQPARKKGDIYWVHFKCFIKLTVQKSSYQTGLLWQSTNWSRGFFDGQSKES